MTIRLSHRRSEREIFSTSYEIIYFCIVMYYCYIQYEYDGTQRSIAVFGHFMAPSQTCMQFLMMHQFLPYWLGCGWIMVFFIFSFVWNNQNFHKYFSIFDWIIWYCIDIGPAWTAHNYSSAWEKRGLWEVEISSSRSLPTHPNSTKFIAPVQ